MTRSHVESELRFDLVSYKHVVNVNDNNDKYNAVLIRKDNTYLRSMDCQGWTNCTRIRWTAVQGKQMGL